MGKDFLVTVTGDRAAEWQAIFGTTTLNVRSPIPEWANLPGKGEVLVYLLDLDLITPEQRQLLVLSISHKFNIPAAEVEQAGLEMHGVPILAEDCMLAVRNPLKWFDVGDVEKGAHYPESWEMWDDDDYDED